MYSYLFTQLYGHNPQTLQYNPLKCFREAPEQTLAELIDFEMIGGLRAIESESQLQNSINSAFDNLLPLQRAFKKNNLFLIFFLLNNGADEELITPFSISEESIIRSYKANKEKLKSRIGLEAEEEKERQRIQLSQQLGQLELDEEEQRPRIHKKETKALSKIQDDHAPAAREQRSLERTARQAQRTQERQAAIAEELGTTEAKEDTSRNRSLRNEQERFQQLMHKEREERENLIRKQDALRQWLKESSFNVGSTEIQRTPAPDDSIDDLATCKVTFSPGTMERLIDAARKEESAFSATAATHRSQQPSSIIPCAGRVQDYHAFAISLRTNVPNDNDIAHAFTTRFLMQILRVGTAYLCLPTDKDLKARFEVIAKITSNKPGENWVSLAFSEEGDVLFHCCVHEQHPRDIRERGLLKYLLHPLDGIHAQIHRDSSGPVLQLIDTTNCIEAAKTTLQEEKDRINNPPAAPSKPARKPLQKGSKQALLSPRSSTLQALCTM